jgi:hypothetical protein
MSEMKSLLLLIVVSGKTRTRVLKTQDPSGSAFRMELKEFMVRKFFAVTV